MTALRWTARRRFQRCSNFICFPPIGVRRGPRGNGCLCCGAWVFVLFYCGWGAVSLLLYSPHDCLGSGKVMSGQSRARHVCKNYMCASPFCNFFVTFLSFLCAMAHLMCWLWV